MRTVVINTSACHDYDGHRTFAIIVMVNMNIVGGLPSVHCLLFIIQNILSFSHSRLHVAVYVTLSRWKHDIMTCYRRLRRVNRALCCSKHYVTHRIIYCTIL